MCIQYTKTEIPVTCILFSFTIKLKSFDDKKMVNIHLYYYLYFVSHITA